MIKVEFTEYDQSSYMDRVNYFEGEWVSPHTLCEMRSLFASFEHQWEKMRLSIPAMPSHLRLRTDYKEKFGHILEEQIALRDAMNKLNLMITHVKCKLGE